MFKSLRFFAKSAVLATALLAMMAGESFAQRGGRGGHVGGHIGGGGGRGFGGGFGHYGFGRGFGGGFGHHGFGRGFGGWGFGGWGYPYYFGGYGGFWPGYYSGYYNPYSYVAPTYSGYNGYYNPYSYAVPYYSGYSGYYNPYSYVAPSYYNPFNYVAPYNYNTPTYATPSTTTYQSLYPPETIGLPANNPAVIEVMLPTPDAQVWFDGVATNKTGTVRLFLTPPLTAGQTYVYQIRARWMVNGPPVTQTRQIQVQSGQQTTVNFTTGY